MFKQFFIPTIFLAFLISCGIKDPISSTPSIEFVSLSKDTIIQGRQFNDSLIINLTFNDGDGDIGFEENLPNIFIIDSRDNFVKEYASPEIPISGAANGVSGEIKILITTLFNVCCIFESGQDPCTQSSTQPYNMFTYNIFIEDRAGNKSNEVTTSQIILRCD